MYNPVHPASNKKEKKKVYRISPQNNKHLIHYFVSVAFKKPVLSTILKQS